MHNLYARFVLWLIRPALKLKAQRDFDASNKWLAESTQRVREERAALERAETKAPSCEQ